MSLLDSLSLLHGAVPWAVPALAAAGLAGAAVRRQRRWWAVTVPRLVAASAASAMAAAWYLRQSGTVRDHYPPTFAVWVGLVPLAALVAAAGWRSAGRWRRVVSLLTVPLTAASAVVLINLHYAYWPTVGDVLGRPLPGQVSGRALDGVLGSRAGPGGGDGAPAGTVTPGGATPGSPDAAAVGLGGAVTAHPSRGRGSGGGRGSAGGELAAGAPSRTGHSVLVAVDIPPGTSGFTSRPGTLYLPPAFFRPSPPPLPVVVLLGGTPGGPDAWARSGALRTVDAYAAQHHGAAPILAFVDQNGSFLGDTECVDGPAGAAETFLTVDVPRYLAGLLHVPLGADRFAVGGFSEGGTCAFELAVRHPETYGTFVDIAGDWAPNLGSATATLDGLYGGDQAAMAAHDPATLLAAGEFDDLAGWFVAGDSDGAHRGVAERLAAASRSAGIRTTAEILPGDHTWRFVVSAFRVVFPALAGQLTARLPPAGPPAGA